MWLLRVSSAFFLIPCRSKPRFGFVGVLGIGQALKVPLASCMVAWVLSGCVWYLLAPWAPFGWPAPCGIHLASCGPLVFTHALEGLFSSCRLASVVSRRQPSNALVVGHKDSIEVPSIRSDPIHGLYSAPGWRTPDAVKSIGSMESWNPGERRIPWNSCKPQSFRIPGISFMMDSKEPGAP